MPKLAFKDRGVVLDVPAGTSVLEAAMGHGVNLYHTCGGNCSCSTCRVIVLQGAQNFSRIEGPEAQVLDAFELKAPYRLGCQALVEGDVEVEIPDRDRPPRASKIPPLPGGPGPYGP